MNKYIYLLITTLLMTVASAQAKTPTPGLFNYGYSCVNDGLKGKSLTEELFVVLSRDEQGNEVATVVLDKFEKVEGMDILEFKRTILAKSLACAFGEKDERVMRCFKTDKNFNSSNLFISKNSSYTLESVPSINPNSAEGPLFREVLKEELQFSFFVTGLTKQKPNIFKWKSDIKNCQPLQEDPFNPED